MTYACMYVTLHFFNNVTSSTLEIKWYIVLASHYQSTLILNLS